MCNEKAVERIKQSFLMESGDSAPQSFHYHGGQFSFLPVGPWILNEPSIIETIATWREAHKDSFFEVFPKSYLGTYSYLKKYSIEDSRRILFLMFFNKNFVGHVGFSNITKVEAHLDNILKGSELPPGSMFESLTVLMKWATEELGIKSFKLQVKKNNLRAIALYKKLGFIENIFTSGSEPQNDLELSLLYTGKQHLSYIENPMRLWMTLQISNQRTESVCK